LTVGVVIQVADRPSGVVQEEVKQLVECQLRLAVRLVEHMLVEDVGHIGQAVVAGCSLAEHTVAVGRMDHGLVVIEDGHIDLEEHMVVVELACQ